MQNLSKKMPKNLISSVPGYPHRPSTVTSLGMTGVRNHKQAVNREYLESS